MSRLSIDGRPWPLDHAATLGQTRASQMPHPARRFRLELPAETVLPVVERILAELADDLRHENRAEFEAEHRWLAAGLPPAAALWSAAPDLLAALLQDLGLTRDVLEAALLRASRPASVWLDPEARIRCEPTALVLEGAAWLRTDGPSGEAD